MSKTLYQLIGSIPKYIGNYHRYEEKFLEITNHIYIDDKQTDVYSLELADLIVNVFSSIEGLSKDIYKFLSNEETGIGTLICFEQNRVNEIRNRSSKGNKSNNTDTDKDPVEITTSNSKLEVVKKKKIPEPKFDCDALIALDSIWGLSCKKIKISSDLIYLTEESSFITPLYNIYYNKRELNKAYQSIKHDRITNIKNATVKNAIESLGALYILCLYGKYAVKPVNDFSSLLDPEPSFVDLYSTFNPSCGSKLFISEPFNLILNDLEYLEKISDIRNIEQNRVLKDFSIDKLKESIFLVQDQDVLLDELFWSYYQDKSNGLNPRQELSLFKLNSFVLRSGNTINGFKIERVLSRHSIHFGGYLNSWERENFQGIKACGYDRNIVLNTFCHVVDSKGEKVECAPLCKWARLKDILDEQKKEVKQYIDI